MKIIKILIFAIIVFLAGFYTHKITGLEKKETVSLGNIAQVELTNAPEEKQPVDTSEVVARIGSRMIRMQEIERMIEKLPEQIKTYVKEGEGKARLIKEYATSEAIYEKGKKLNLLQTPQAKEFVEEMSKQFVIKDMIELELKEKLIVTDQELKLYYETNQKYFTTPGTIDIRFIELVDSAKKDKVINQLKNKEGQKAEGIIKSRPAIIGIGLAKEAVDKLFTENKDAIVGPLEINKKNYIFMIDDKKEEQVRPFDQVKPEVESAYKTQKQDEIVNNFVNKTIEESGLEVLFKPSVKDEEKK